jgi:hypothetical protein
MYCQPNEAAKTRKMKMKNLLTASILSPMKLGWQPQIGLRAPRLRVLVASRPYGWLTSTSGRGLEAGAG